MCAGLGQIWKYMLAYYVGQWSLKGTVYPLPKKGILALDHPMLDVADGEVLSAGLRRLFAACGLDFDQASRRELFDEFVGLVDRLPDQGKNKLKAELQKPTAIMVKC